MGLCRWCGNNEARHDIDCPDMPGKPTAWIVKRKKIKDLQIKKDVAEVRVDEQI